MSTAAALVGLVLAVFGGRMLVTGKAPGVIARSFRTPRQAGGYHLLFGLAVLVFIMGATQLTELAAMIATLVAVGLVAVAVVYFRPGSRSRDHTE
jgi:predicted MFS family arabinose efflux permease